MFKRTNSCFFIIGALGLAACDSSPEEPEMQTGDIPITDEFGREPAPLALGTDDASPQHEQDPIAEEQQDAQFADAAKSRPIRDKGKPGTSPAPSTPGSSQAPTP